MNKKELLAKINAKVQEVKNLVSEDKIEEAKSAKAELNKLQDKYDLIKDMEDDETQSVKDGIKLTKSSGAEDHTKEFAKAAKMGFPKNSMSEGSNEDGGYTVPEDIQTKINEYRSSKFSLESLVTVEPTTKKSGSRTYKKRSQQTGFTKVGEGGKIGSKATPQFEIITYDIDKYAGYFPVTNELLEDSDANITETLINWIGDESRVTRNKLIIAAVGTKTKTSISDTDDIKKALNVTLGAAFKNTSSITTNDDGFQWLDTLKDKDGKYLLQPMVTDASQYKLFNKIVNVIPNDDMPSDISEAGKRKIPFIIGDLKEGIVLFDRKKTTITSSNVAVAGTLNAFEEDLTLWKAIEREDVKVKDSVAFVNGELVIDDASVTGATE